MKTISRYLLYQIIGMEESMDELLARLHKEWKERISADEEANQVSKEQISI